MGREKRHDRRAFSPFACPNGAVRRRTCLGALATTVAAVLIGSGVAQAAESNVALNKLAISSTPLLCSGGSGTGKAVDGKWTNIYTDKWCAPSAASLTVNIGPGSGYGYTLNRFVVRHAGAAGESSAYNTRTFSIQTSPQGLSWTTVAMVEGNTASVTTHLVEGGIANVRSVRLIVTGPTQTGFGATRIYELEAYGDQTPPPPPPPPAPPPPLYCPPGWPPELPCPFPPGD